MGLGTKVLYYYILSAKHVCRYDLLCIFVMKSLEVIIKVFKEIQIESSNEIPNYFFFPKTKRINSKTKEIKTGLDGPS